MDDFSRIRTFINVVEAGSFSAAARDVSISSVTRQVKSLEDELGVRLLNRSTRSLGLTEAGRTFYERVTSIIQDLNNATSEARSLHDEVKGSLRVSLRIVAGTTVVIPALPKFLESYPDLDMDVVLTDERRDLISNNIDVAMWLGNLPDADIIARRLTPSQRIVVGSPAYFEKRGIPEIPRDLLRHSCLLFNAPSYSNSWIFGQGGRFEEVHVRGSLRSENGLVLLSAAVADMGVMIAHHWMVRDLINAGRLQQILGDYTVNPRPGDAELYAVFQSSRQLSRKIRVFVDFLVRLFAASTRSNQGESRPE